MLTKMREDDDARDNELKKLRQEKSNENVNS
jgi:hypothetical protein